MCDYVRTYVCLSKHACTYAVCLRMYIHISVQGVHSVSTFVPTYVHTYQRTYALLFLMYVRTYVCIIHTLLCTTYVVCTYTLL